jgi:hypothetical protein
MSTSRAPGGVCFSVCASREENRQCRSLIFLKKINMNTNGPSCPKCQEALPYHFAFKLFNPYDFRCPHCDGRLHSRMITIQILGYAVIGALGTVPVFWFYVVSWAWSTTMFITYLTTCFPLAVLASHFVFWKTDTLISRTDAHTSAEPAGKSETRALVSHGA